MRGRKPVPSALKRARGNPGKRALNHDEPTPGHALPRCPDHLSATARKEWRRLARPLHEMGILTVCDRAALAAYCQAWARWVEAERKLAEGPALIRAPSGYVQQSPWLSIANKQLEIMNRFMGELGLTPSARSRLSARGDTGPGSGMVVNVLDRFDANPLETLLAEIADRGRRITDCHGETVDVVPDPTPKP